MIYLITIKLYVNLLYIYIYIYLGSAKIIFRPPFLFCLWCAQTKQKRWAGVLFYLKARAITSGETPQKSIILPPVHTFIKMLVAPLNLIFSYFYRISGGVKIANVLTFDENCKKFTKNYKKL